MHESRKLRAGFMASEILHIWKHLNRTCVLITDFERKRAINKSVDFCEKSVLSSRHS